MTIGLCLQLVFVGLIAIDDASSGRTTARQIYESAVEASRAGGSSSAREKLGRLLADFGESPIAPLAALHACELELAQDKPQKCLDLLRDWRDRIKASELVAQLEPEAAERVVQLQLRALSSIRDQPDHRLELMQFLQSMDIANRADETKRLFVQAVAALASDCNSATDYRIVIDLLQPLREVFLAKGFQDLLEALNFGLPAALAFRQLEREDASGCLETIDLIVLDGLTLDQQEVFHFLSMEALIRTGQDAQSIEHMQWLESHLPNRVSPANWEITLAIRRAEQYLRDKDYAACQALLETAHERFATFPGRYEFDFIQARCAIAQADFATAVGALRKVLDSEHTIDQDARPKALWLWGEVLFLQKRYDAASQQYELAAKFEVFPQWHSRALMQLAKCQELMGRYEPALETYGQVCRRYSEFEKQAQVRMAVLRANIAHKH